MLVSWDNSTVRPAPEFIVQVNGVKREIISVNWEQDLANAMPAAVAGGDAFAQRTGSITWFSSGISNELPSPWDADGGWLPQIEDRVTVDVKDHVSSGLIRVFTGRIDTVESDDEGVVISHIIDQTDDFNKVIRIGALTSHGLPWVDNKPRRNAATGAWVVDQIARECGYFSTPPPPPGYILDAPLQGTVYTYAESPHKNSQLIQATSEQDDPSTNPRWKSGGGRGRLALGGAALKWTPYSAGGTGNTTAFRMSILIHPDHDSNTTTQIFIGAGGIISFRVDRKRLLSVFVRNSDLSNAEWYPCFTLPASDEPIAISGIFRNGQVDIASSDGQSKVFSRSIPTGEIDEIWLNNDLGASVSGFQVSDPGSSGGHIATNFVPNMFQSYGWHAWWQECAPSVRDKKAKDVLKQFAEATCTPVWLDGEGNLNVVHSDHLNRASHALTVDMTSNARDLRWSLRMSDLRDPVHIDYSETAVSINLEGKEKSVLVYQGNGRSMKKGEQYEELIEIPEDEEWIGISIMDAWDQAADHNMVRNLGSIWESQVTGADSKGNLGFPTILNQTWYQQFKDHIYSYWGGSMDKEYNYVDGEQVRTANAEINHPFTFWSTKNINPWKWKYHVKMNFADGSLRICSDDPGVPPHLRGEGLPMIRAGGRVKYSDSRITKTFNKSGRMELVHDMGKWCTTDAVANAFGNWLANELKDPHPIITGLTCRFDPRIEVGSVIQIDSTQLHGVAIKGLVTGVSHRPEEDITRPRVRVISADSSIITSYEELRTAWEGANYANLSAAWSAINGTYRDLANDPTWNPGTQTR